MSAAVTKSEDILGQRWDRCIADTAIKVGGGLVIGAVASVVLFKRRTWPITFGLGSGLGMGYSNCHFELNKPYSTSPKKTACEVKEGSGDCCHKS